MQRDHLNQTFESNLEMKEENQILKEQDMVRNEQLQQCEKKIDTLEVELRFYKDQNNDLIKRLDEFE
jgi:hypothetical protein